MTWNPWSEDARSRILSPAEACQEDLADLQQAVADLGVVRLAHHETRFRAFTGPDDRHDVLARWNRANERLDEACAALEVRAERLARSLTRLAPRDVPRLH